MPDPMNAGINDVLTAHGAASPIPGACPWCSSAFSAVIHGGACPRVKAISYYPNGSVDRIEFHNPGAFTS